MTGSRHAVVPLLALALVLGGCSSSAPSFASCAEVAAATGDLLIAAVDAGATRVPEPAPGEAGGNLIDRLVAGVEDSALRARAAAVQQAAADLECGGDDWADEQVAMRLGDEAEARLRRLAAEGRQPSASERNALNLLAILQGALRGDQMGVDVDLFG